MDDIDLTGGKVRVIGNRGDVHSFRLTNPVDDEIISVDGLYEGEFFSHLGTIISPVEIDVEDVENGVLIFSLTITSGVYRIRRTNPRRTILTIEVEAL